ncbi:MAG: exo-alpha-sialidase [Acidobacteria bacterium]|nr:exo-alpha-sialidase [Acidobacteriota bacterium]
MRTLSIVWMLAAPAVALAADPMASPVYVSGRDGYHTYRIPALIVSKNGTALAFAEGRKSGRGDSGDIDMLVKRSADGGRTWSAHTVVWDDGLNTCGNACPVVDQRTGRIVLLMTWNRGEDHGGDLHKGTAQGTRRVFVATSDDDGRTWSKPREITAETKAADWWWYATGPGVGIQLERGPHKGRLVIPANHSSAANGYGAHTIYSDDGGETWKRSNAIQPACNESQVAELADGTLMMNMRSQSPTNQERTGYRSIAFSRDGGATWSAPEFDAHLGDPAVQASLLRFSWSEDGGDRLVFSNPSPPIQPARGERIDMTVRASPDGGKSWPWARQIHHGPSGYSSLTRLPDGSIGILFEGGEKSYSEALLFESFSLDWLEGGAAR